MEIRGNGYVLHAYERESRRNGNINGIIICKNFYNYNILGGTVPNDGKRNPPLKVLQR